MDSEKFPNCLYLNEELSDVRVIVDNGMTKWNFPAHALVLKKQSSVLETMLDSDFAEGKSRTIVITDFKTRNVKHFLKFLYTDTLPEMYSSLCNLLKLSHKYMVTRLTSNCEQALFGFVNLQNVFELYHIADLYSLNDLRGKCLALIKRAAFKLLKCDELEYISKEVLEDIVSDTELNVNNEMDVFWAIWKWGNLNTNCDGAEICNESVLVFTEDLLKHVRWSLLKKEDKDKITNLGISVDEIVLQKHERRQPAAFDTPCFLEMCTVFQLDNLASSCTFEKKVFPNDGGRCFLSFVSLSNIPLYVVGLSLALTNIKEDLRFFQIICSCEPQFSGVRNSNFQTIKHYEIESVTYEEATYEFLKPVQVGRNETVCIHVTSKRDSEIGSFELKFENTLLSSNGKKLRLEGAIYGITKLFLL